MSVMRMEIKLQPQFNSSIYLHSISKGSASCHALILRGIIHFKFLPQGPTVNQTVYKEILRRLVRSVRVKRRSLWEAHAWTLHYNNAPAHTALSIRQFLAERNFATLEHPSHFPDLAPHNFFLFPKIKSVLKGTGFSDNDFIKMAAMTELKKISENAFQECFESWKRRMHKCFQVKGDYFEGILLWYISIFFNKVFITPVSLLFGHTSY